VKIENEQAAAGSGQALDMPVDINQGSYPASQRRQRKRLHDGMVFSSLIVLIIN